MKRTQLYLDEDTARILAALSRQRKTTISQLVRESIREKYSGSKQVDKAVLARQLSGIWSGTKDRKAIDHEIRKLRKGRPSRRWRLG